jgi:hypothetical protein
MVDSGIPGVLPPSQDLSATGFLRAPAVPVEGGIATVDLSGTVTCIGVWLPGFAVAVSGRLNTPFVTGTFTVSNFTLLIWRAFGRTPWLWLTAIPVPGPAAGTCGINLFFLAGLDQTHVMPEYHLTSGNLVINGTT